MPTPGKSCGLPGRQRRPVPRPRWRNAGLWGTRESIELPPLHAGWRGDPGLQGAHHRHPARGPVLHGHGWRARPVRRDPQPEAVGRKRFADLLTHHAHLPWAKESRPSSKSCCCGKGRQRQSRRRDPRWHRNLTVDVQEDSAAVPGEAPVGCGIDPLNHVDHLEPFEGIRRDATTILARCPPRCRRCNRDWPHCPCTRRNHWPD